MSFIRLFLQNFIKKRAKKLSAHQIICQKEYHYMLQSGFEGNINLLASILRFNCILVCWTLKILNKSLGKTLILRNVWLFTHIFCFVLCAAPEPPWPSPLRTVPRYVLLQNRIIVVKPEVSHEKVVHWLALLDWLIMKLLLQATM